MNVIFPLAGKLDVREAHALAAIMIASVRRAMPHARITQISDAKYPAVPGVDSVLRHAWAKVDWIVFRYEALLAFALAYGSHLMLDYDIVVRKDVSGVMQEDFDIAMCVTPDRADAVLNGGVIFCKTHRLYSEGLRIYLSRPDLQDAWEGGQTTQSMAAKAMRCKFLDFDTYNFTPSGPGKVPASASIVHYRGRRKRFMAQDNPELMEMVNG